MIHAAIKREREREKRITYKIECWFIHQHTFFSLVQTNTQVHSVLWDKVPLYIPDDNIRFECQSEQGSKTLAKPESQVLTGCNHYVGLRSRYFRN